MSRQGNYHGALPALKDFLIQQIVDWLTNLIRGKTPYHFEHSHNKIKSNVDKETLLKTRYQQFDEIGVRTIFVQYGDGGIKTFDELRWHIHGNNILKNCPKIKVIVIR